MAKHNSIPPYVTLNLKLYGNTLVHPKKVKNTQEYIELLRLRGFECDMKRGISGMWIITDISKGKPIALTLEEHKSNIKGIEYLEKIKST